MKNAGSWVDDMQHGFEFELNRLSKIHRVALLSLVGLLQISNSFGLDVSQKCSERCHVGLDAGRSDAVSILLHCLSST